VATALEGSVVTHAVGRRTTQEPGVAGHLSDAIFGTVVYSDDLSVGVRGPEILAARITVGLP
jgi:hypothetical protein